MLERATAARAEVRTDRRDPLGARTFDRDRQSTVGVTGPRFGFYGFAWQCEWNKNRPLRGIGDAVAAPSETGNRQSFDHALRLEHDPENGNRFMSRARSGDHAQMQKSRGCRVQITAPPGGAHA